MHRLYQEKEREIRQAMTPLLNTLGQYESENKGEDPVISKGEDLRQRPTVALGARPTERQRSAPAGNQREYEWAREEQGHAPKVPDWSNQYEPRCKSSRASHYHPRNSAYLEPKSEYPRSRNIEYIAQESEYGAHEEFGYRERKDNARIEQCENSYDKPHKYTPAELLVPCT